MTDPNFLSVCHLGCSGPQFFRCHIPNNVCWLKRRLRGLCWSVNQDEWPISPFFVMSLFSYLPNDTWMCSSMLLVNHEPVRILLSFLSSFGQTNRSEIIEPDLWPACLKICQCGRNLICFVCLFLCCWSTWIPRVKWNPEHVGVGLELLCDSTNSLQVEYIQYMCLCVYVHLCEW